MICTQKFTDGIRFNGMGRQLSDFLYTSYLAELRQSPANDPAVVDLYDIDKAPMLNLDNRKPSAHYHGVDCNISRQSLVRIFLRDFRHINTKIDDSGRSLG